MRILIVEDDVEAASYIRKGLEELGHVVDAAADGELGLSMALNQDYDVLVVDRMLPHLDGLSLVKRLRQKERQTPVLILSALGEVDQKVEGLKAGGDDYLTKPYAFTELIARIEAVTRRQDALIASTHLRIGDLEIDLLARTAKRENKEIVLQNREFKLLEYMMRHAGQVVTRTMLLEQVWDYHFDPQTNVIDVHISRLRTKIDRGFDKPLLHTVRGMGYRLEA